MWNNGVAYWYGSRCSTRLSRVQTPALSNVCRLLKFLSFFGGASLFGGTFSSDFEWFWTSVDPVFLSVSVPSALSLLMSPVYCLPSPFLAPRYQLLLQLVLQLLSPTLLATTICSGGTGPSYAPQHRLCTMLVAKMGTA